MGHDDGREETAMDREDRIKEQALIEKRPRRRRRNGRGSKSDRLRLLLRRYYCCCVYNCCVSMNNEFAVSQVFPIFFHPDLLVLLLVLLSVR
jgi:hypothetical protein